MELYKIPAKAVIPIRQQVLRIGEPEENCWFEGDLLSSTHHFGLHVDRQLVGIVSVYKNNSNLFTQKNQYQIRGMAVLQHYQKQGFGEQMLAFAEVELKNLQCDLIWFNARKVAVGFYEKLGYCSVGHFFDVGQIGEHIVMFK